MCHGGMKVLGGPVQTSAHKGIALKESVGNERRGINGLSATLSQTLVTASSANDLAYSCLLLPSHLCEHCCGQHHRSRHHVLCGLEEQGMPSGHGCERACVRHTSARGQQVCSSLENVIQGVGRSELGGH